MLRKAITFLLLLAVSCETRRSSCKEQQGLPKFHLTSLSKKPTSECILNESPGTKLHRSIRFNTQSSFSILSAFEITSDEYSLKQNCPEKYFLKPELTVANQIPPVFRKLGWHDPSLPKKACRKQCEIFRNYRNKFIFVIETMCLISFVIFARNLRSFSQYAQQKALCLRMKVE